MIKRFIFISSVIFIESFRYDDYKNINIQFYENQETYKDCEILIYSPYDCYNDIKFYKSGLGFFSTGRQYEDSSAGVKNLNDSSMNRIPFNIHSEDERLKITKLILYIKSRERHTSHRIYDVFHFVLKIDEVKYIDLLQILRSIKDGRLGLFNLLDRASIRKNLNKQLGSFIASRIVGSSGGSGNKKKFILFSGNPPPAGSSSSHPNYLQKIDYEYHIRGWLNSINEVASFEPDYDETDLFNERIDYDAIVESFTIRQYNGNVSETAWKGAYDEYINGYSYTYDKANRLTSANFGYGTVSSGDNFNFTFTNKYNESSINYDHNGNLTSLSRYHGNAAILIS